MAFVYEESFRLSPQVAQSQPYLAADIALLLKNLKTVLSKISGAPIVTPEGNLYEHPPKGLDPHRDGLKPNYRSIWSDTIVSYDPDGYGATADLKEFEINFGYFFSKPQSILVLEKVLLHEFLHLIVNLPKPMHHGRINHIIQHSSKIPGDPNPLGTVGLECGGL